MSNENSLMSKLFWPLVVVIIGGVILLYLEYKTNFFRENKPVEPSPIVSSVIITSETPPINPSSSTTIPYVTTTPIALLTIEPKLVKSERANSWITCDDNISIQSKFFTWKGPDAGTCHITLLEGEFVVGTADRYQENINASADRTRCVAFLFMGQLDLDVSMNKGGGGDYYSSSTSYNEQYFREKWLELDNGEDCNCNPGHRCYDKVICTQAGCATEPIDIRDKAAQTLGYSNLDAFMVTFGIPTEIKSLIFVCPNEETWCLGVYEKQGQPSFHFKNVMSCNLDGKQESGTSGIPIGFDGNVKGFTVRPCK